jgi:hypothetical protein
MYGDKFYYWVVQGGVFLTKKKFFPKRKMKKRNDFERFQLSKGVKIAKFLYFVFSV